MKLLSWLRVFARGEEGQDLLEYALLVALIALVCVVAVTGAGQAVSNIFNGIASAIASVPIPAP